MKGVYIASSRSNRYPQKNHSRILRPLTRRLRMYKPPRRLRPTARSIWPDSRRKAQSNARTIWPCPEGLLGGPEYLALMPDTLAPVQKHFWGARSIWPSGRILWPLSRSSSGQPGVSGLGPGYSGLREQNTINLGSRIFAV